MTTLSAIKQQDHIVLHVNCQKEKRDYIKTPFGDHFHQCMNVDLLSVLTPLYWEQRHI